MKRIDLRVPDCIDVEFNYVEYAVDCRTHAELRVILTKGNHVFQYAIALNGEHIRTMRFAIEKGIKALNEKKSV